MGARRAALDRTSTPPGRPTPDHTPRPSSRRPGPDPAQHNADARRPTDRCGPSAPTAPPSARTNLAVTRRTATKGPGRPSSGPPTPGSATRQSATAADPPDHPDRSGRPATRHLLHHAATPADAAARDGPAQPRPGRPLPPLPPRRGLASHTGAVPGGSQGRLVGSAPRDRPASRPSAATTPRPHRVGDQTRRRSLPIQRFERPHRTGAGGGVRRRCPRRSGPAPGWVPEPSDQPARPGCCDPSAVLPSAQTGVHRMRRRRRSEQPGDAQHSAAAHRPVGPHPVHSRAWSRRTRPTRGQRRPGRRSVACYASRCWPTASV